MEKNYGSTSDLVESRKKASSVKLLRFRDFFVTMEPSLFWSAQWNCLSRFTKMQTDSDSILLIEH